jgi:hypothetical protein
VVSIPPALPPEELTDSAQEGVQLALGLDAVKADVRRVRAAGESGGVEAVAGGDQAAHVEAADWFWAGEVGDTRVVGVQELEES